MAASLTKLVNVPNDPLPPDATPAQIAAWTPRIDQIVPLTADEIADRNARDAQFVIDKAKIDSNKYLFDRRKEYPDIQDQLLALWNSMDAGEIPQSKAFYNAIKAVNDKYPAPAVTPVTPVSD